MKRTALLCLPLLVLIVMLTSCDVVRVDVETTILSDESGTYTLLVEELPDEEGECPESDEGEAPSVMVSTPEGDRCRTVWTLAFPDLNALTEVYTEYGEAVQLSCLRLVEDTLFVSMALVFEDAESSEDAEPSEEDVGVLSIRFIIPGPLLSSNAPIREGNALTWTIDTAAPPERLDMLINMVATDTCPPEWALESEADSQPGDPAPEQEAEPSPDTEADLTQLINDLPPDIMSKIPQRMGCSEADADACEPMLSANKAASDLIREITKQIPEPNAIEAEKALQNIQRVSFIAFSRDASGELIYPSLHASLPVIIQLAWNGMESPKGQTAMIRFSALLADYDDRRYVADHGE